jgi:hypothetical protein
VLVVGRVGIVGDDFSRHDAFGSALDAMLLWVILLWV